MDSFDGAVDHKANARLIAAAPTLVDVLETMMRLEQTQGVSDDDWDACWERARAVLRQVRGEE